jgi:hypothetical protein
LSSLHQEDHEAIISAPELLLRVFENIKLYVKDNWNKCCKQFGIKSFSIKDIIENADSCTVSADDEDLGF